MFAILAILIERGIYVLFEVKKSTCTLHSILFYYFYVMKAYTA